MWCEATSRVLSLEGMVSHPDSTAGEHFLRAGGANAVEEARCARTERLQQRRESPLTNRFAQFRNDVERDAFDGEVVAESFECATASRIRS